MSYLFCFISHTWHGDLQQIRDKKPLGAEGVLCSGGERLLWPQAVRARPGVHHAHRGQRRPRGDPGHPTLEVQQLLLPLLPAAGELAWLPSVPASRCAAPWGWQGGVQEFPAQGLREGFEYTQVLINEFCSLCAPPFHGTQLCWHPTQSCGVWRCLFSKWRPKTLLALTQRSATDLQ